ADIRRAAGIGRRRVDVVFGGPPCQGFSLIGQRAFDDPRNALVREFVRLVCEIDASYFVFENVKGLTVGKHRAFHEELIDAVKRSDKNGMMHMQELNPGEYGVPQDRQRLFLIGAKRGIAQPAYLARAMAKPGGTSALPKVPTCSDALGELPDAECF